MSWSDGAFNGAAPLIFIKVLKGHPVIKEIQDRDLFLKVSVRKAVPVPFLLNLACY